MATQTLLQIEGYYTALQNGTVGHRNAATCFFHIAQELVHKSLEALKVSGRIFTSVINSVSYHAMTSLSHLMIAVIKT